MTADVWVDFNDLGAYAPDELSTFAHYARPGVVLTRGAKVVAGDDDGLECDAIILDARPNGLLRLRVLTDTFRETGEAFEPND